MEASEPREPSGSRDGSGPPSAPVAIRPPGPPRYGRYVGLLAILILALITINTIVTKPNGASGIAPGHAMPPFAVPLATGSLHGDADVATRANEGAAGRKPACDVRGAQVLNICQLYEEGPTVLVLFVDAGSCADVLGQLQTLMASYPGLRFAAVAIKGERASLRRLIRARRLTMPVGVDEDGALAALYKVASCPQVTFAAKGGTVQSKALLHTPDEATLRARLNALQAGAR